MQTRRLPTFPHFFDLLFISWNAGSWDEEITNILSSEGNTSNRFKIRSSEFVTIIFIQKTYPCQRLRQYDHTLDSCGFSSPESTQKNEYNTLQLASGRKKTTAEFKSVLIWWEIILHLEVFSRIDSLLTFLFARISGVVKSAVTKSFEKRRGRGELFILFQAARERFHIQDYMTWRFPIFK